MADKSSEAGAPPQIPQREPIRYRVQRFADGVARQFCRLGFHHWRLSIDALDAYCDRCGEWR